MPHTISYKEIIEDFITEERLRSYKVTFKTQSDIELLGAYLWNTHVCSAIYPLLSATEVALRNAIDSALTSSDLGYFWWKKNKLHFKSFDPEQPDKNPPFEVEAIRKNFSKATKQVQQDKKKRYNIANPTPMHQEIIAKTEFSTWEYILSKEFMGPGLIWPTHLGTVFKGEWNTTKTKELLINTKDLVKTVREFRNRVSHHEPVWKKYGVETKIDAIEHLRYKISKILQLLELVSPEKKRLLEKNKIIERAYRACTLGELRRFQHNIATHNVKSISKLCRLVQSAHDANSVEKIQVYEMGKISFLIHPN
ncbi:CAAX protease [Shewanella xiamenensis]|uniref:Abi family protein n=1 Tax=Shewanella xiamenensis TaxID=332186 RepID=UPI001C4F613A|nr:Abi family protein [Shewanella xiamenensis]MBW0278507.1 CAAX protease [Shewanella xiamenensis]